MFMFYCNKFTGHYPVGTAAIIIASSVDEAIGLLEEELRSRGLRQRIRPEQLTVIDLGHPQALILQDGNY